MTNVRQISIVATLVILLGTAATLGLWSSKTFSCDIKDKDNWITYQANDLAFTFQYPTGFDLVLHETKFSRLKGLSYFDIRFASQDGQWINIGNFPTGAESDTPSRVPTKVISDRSGQRIVRNVNLFEGQKDLYRIEAHTPKPKNDRSGFWMFTGPFNQTQGQTLIPLYDCMLGSFQLRND